MVKGLVNMVLGALLIFTLFVGIIMLSNFVNYGTFIFR